MLWAVTRDGFIAEFKTAVAEVLGVSPELYAGHSLRRGGVTELLSRQCHLPALLRHVGWAAGSTAVYDYYDHAAPAQMLAPSRLMGSAL